MKEFYNIALMAGETFDGGLVACLMNYIRHVDRKRFRYVFYISEEPSEAGRKELTDLGVEIVVIPSRKHMVRYMRFMIAEFRRRKFDILHANLTALNFFPLLAGWIAGIPVRISHSHSTAHRVEWKRNILKNSLRLVSHAFATDYFACSQLAGRWLFGKRFFDKGRVKVLLNAIELKRFGYDEDARQSLRREFGLEGRFVIGHAGRFVRQKNHTFVIDIFAAVARQNPEARLLLLGKGPLQPEIQEKVAALGLADKVVFTGERTDVARFYSAMDVFLFPSLFEGLGMVLVEAQANGLPSVASTEVPSEAKMTPLVDFLPLSTSPNTWATACLAAHRPADLQAPVKSLISAGYDITTAAHDLESAYEQAYERVTFKENANGN